MSSAPIRMQNSELGLLQHGVLTYLELMPIIVKCNMGNQLLT